MLITHATLLTFDREQRILPDHALLLREGRIAALGPTAALQAQYPT